MILVLSQNSASCDWRQYELELTKMIDVPGHVGQFDFRPVALDESWKSYPWPEPVPEQLSRYSILDFSGWEGGQFGETEEKLIRSLDLCSEE